MDESLKLNLIRNKKNGQISVSFPKKKMEKLLGTKLNSVKSIEIKKSGIKLW